MYNTPKSENNSKIKKGRLDKMLVYLTGPMEYAKDGGSEWREFVTPKLQEFGLGILNPVDKPTQKCTESEETRILLKQALQKEDYNYVYNKVNEIIAVDLRLVDISQFLVGYIDIDVNTIGTIHEIVIAVQQHKPVLLVCKQGKNKLPLWIYGLIPSDLLFNSWEELLNYLTHINSDKEINELNRWKFFDYDKVYGVTA